MNFNRFLIDLQLYIKICMSQIRPQRQKKYASVYSAISAVLAVAHGVTIYYSYTLAIEIDALEEKQGTGIKDWNYKQNLPFFATTIVIAAFQLISSLLSLIGLINWSEKGGQARLVYRTALVSILSTFAIGVSLTILASQYNTFTRDFLKNSSILPSLIPFYYCLQIDSTVSLLITFPSMFYVFYRYLQKYLVFKKTENVGYYQTTSKQNTFISKNMQVWFLGLFLLNSLAQVVFIINIYQFTGVENTKDYSLDNIADQYVFYFAVAIVASVVSYSIQIWNFSKNVISKHHKMLIVLVPLLFQVGSLNLMLVKTEQLGIELDYFQKQKCYFLDCDEANIFRWEIMSYTILNFLTLCGHIPYIISLLQQKEEEVKRDTLLTQQ